jgi:GcrA cell cycle regulator
MTQSATWSDDRVTILKTLWLSGASAAQIARQLGGVTRNAVIGKVHRLGLSGRARPSRPGRAPRNPTPRAARPARPAPPPRTRVRESARPAPEGPGLIADMSGLKAHMCKWPIGDPKAADFSFCGRAADGLYCARHAMAAVRPGTAWRASRDPVVRRALAGLI